MSQIQQEMQIRELGNPDPLPPDTSAARSACYEEVTIVHSAFIT